MPTTIDLAIFPTDFDSRHPESDGYPRLILPVRRSDEASHEQLDLPHVHEASEDTAVVARTARTNPCFCGSRVLTN